MESPADQQEISTRDERAAASLLTLHGVARGALSTQQWDVLVRYCRQVRRSRWSIVPVLLLAAVGLYLAAWRVPQYYGEVFSAIMPADILLVDHVKHTNHLQVADPDVRDRYVQSVMMVGTLAGIVAATTLFLVIHLLFRAGGGYHRKFFLQYLQESHAAPAVAVNG